MWQQSNYRLSSSDYRNFDKHTTWKLLNISVIYLQEGLLRIGHIGLIMNDRNSIMYRPARQNSQIQPSVNWRISKQRFTF